MFDKGGRGKRRRVGWEIREESLAVVLKTEAWVHSMYIGKLKTTCTPEQDLCSERT
jgi:hypothetical protein